MVKEYDYIVIGGGSGGIASAIVLPCMVLRLFSLKERGRWYLCQCRLCA